MNAIEIKGLSKSFRGLYAVNELNMTVPQGAIYGFIGENGSGKSTTEKLICGLLVPNGGSIKLFGKDYTDAEVRSKIGVLIESPGCFPNYSVWNNMLLQAANLGIKNPKEEISKVLKTVRMEGAASNKYKNCSLGMKQRIGIAMALLGDPALLILDEPINRLDTDGMRIMREILVDVTKTYGCTVLISSHILGELEKIATHYGIIRQGKMVQELSAEEMDARNRVFVSVKTQDMNGAKNVLCKKFGDVREEENYLRVYDNVHPEEVVAYLYEHNVKVTEITTEKVSLEEYYIDLMGKERA